MTIVAIAAVLAILAYTVFGNSRQRDIIGTWVTGPAGQECGFRCGVHGIAASINITTRQYNSWRLSRNCLILDGKTFEGKRVFDISDTLKIKKLTSKLLTVEQEGETLNYRKTL
jgi:hypothetical protein